MSTQVRGEQVCTACGQKARFHKLASIRVRCPAEWGSYDITPRGETDARASTGEG